MKNKIKLFDPFIGKKEEQRVLKVLRSGFWASGMGDGPVQEFEDKFQKYIGAKNCVALNSGTAALHLALSTLKLNGGEVILPSLSFASTAHSILYNLGKPIFVDVDPKTLCIDPIEVEKKISRRSKAILPVHFAGTPARMKELSKIAKTEKLSIIEDAAHACGTSYNEKKIGTHSNFVCFSFHPIKNLSMPTGGAIVLNGSNHNNLKNILKARRWCGITNRKDSIYDIKEIGWNFYMNNISATVGIVQLERLDKLNNKRKKIAKKYFKKINVESKMHYIENCSYHLYWILVKNRKIFREKMYVAGIETGIHYKPIHKMSMYNNNIKLPVTELVGNQIVSLPIHPNLSENDVDKIITTVNNLV